MEAHVRKRILLTAGTLIAAGAGLLAAASPAGASPATTGGAARVVGHTYVNDNTHGANTIAGFDRHADGSLTPMPGSPFAAGGSGLGAGSVRRDRSKPVPMVIFCWPLTRAATRSRSCGSPPPGCRAWSDRRSGPAGSSRSASLSTGSGSSTSPMSALAAATTRASGSPAPGS